ncbi:MAG: M13 family peptidase, partial [Enterococcus hulanensis]
MDKTKIKEDLYEAVNGEWIRKATIPADKPATGGFQDLVDDIDDLLMADTKKMSDDPSLIPNDLMKEYLAYFQLANDYQKRDQDGAEPMLPLLKQVEELKDLADLDQQITSWVLDGLPLPFGVDVDADMKNTKINALFAGAPSLILPDKTYYEPDHPQAPQLLAIFKEMTMKLFTLAGYEAAEAEKITDEALQYDKLL